MKVREKLKEINNKLKKANIEDSIFKARMLLEYELNLQKNTLAMHLEDEMEENFEEDVKKLLDGVPIQYITNYQSFYGLDFYVDSNVLIPQPDTEILVEEVMDRIKDRKLKILDMCTGSGAIAIAIAKNIDCEVFASDISKKALKIAKKNATFNKVDIRFIESDLFENITEKFEMIVSNPPYIETRVLHTLPKEVQKEPQIALDGGEDGLEFYKKLVDESRNFLEKDGILAVEIGYNQKIEVIEIFEKYRFSDIYCKKDFGNNDRIVLGKWRK